MTFALPEEQHGVPEKKKRRNHIVDDDPEESDETPSSMFTRRNVPRHQENSALAQKRKARSASQDEGVSMNSQSPESRESCVQSFKIHPIQEPETVKEFVRVLLHLFVLIAEN